jgi:hypothetical protein
MAGKKAIDQYANIAALTLTESAANTQTSVKFQFPFSIMDKMGLVISRIEYDLQNLGWAAATSDRLRVGLIAGPSVVDMDSPSDPIIIDMFKFYRFDMGAAATGVLFNTPYVRDFSSLPGQGLLVAPNPLYGVIQGLSAAAAGICTVKLFYTYIELATDEYWQLVESRRIISN